jgi:hypothetical protein
MQEKSKLREKVLIIHYSERRGGISGELGSHIYSMKQAGRL